MSFGELRILIIEDESMITMLLEDTLADMGCQVVAVASQLDEAMEKAASLDFDVAILDVNLNGSQSYPVAEALVKRSIPFVFTTGYGAAGVPEKFRQVPLLPKPFQPGDLENAVAAAFALASASRTDAGLMVKSTRVAGDTFDEGAS